MDATVDGKKKLRGFIGAVVFQPLAYRVEYLIITNVGHKTEDESKSCLFLFPFVCLFVLYQRSHKGNQAKRLIRVLISGS